MSRLFVSPSTGAGVYTFSHDHCPPHVHVLHRGEGWVARIRFSFLGSDVAVMSMAPLQNLPLGRVLSCLLEEIAAELAACRRAWWTVRQTACLFNRWVVAATAETLRLASATTPEARQIDEAVYSPDEEALYVVLRHGPAMKANVRR